VLKFCVCLIAMLTALLSADVVRPQDSSALGSRFFSVTITRNEKPLLAEVLFEDTADNLIVQGMPLAAVIGRAYGVQTYQVVDAPAWVYESHLYDIEAAPPPAALVESDEMQMLQSLLADRFQLQVQHVMRDVSIFVLDTGTEELKLEPGDKSIRMGMYSHASVGEPNRLWGNVSIDRLAVHLAQRFRLPVLNLTDLGDDPYTIRVEGFDDSDPATLTDVLRDQTGLVFERRTVPMEVLVVTAVDHPQLDAIDR
jgi:uncharacterized protein (TIGR03435 family)